MTGRRSNPAETAKQTLTEVQMLKASRRLGIRRLWGVIRWKMLLIFGFFSLVSVGLVSCLAIAVLNVVIRRENAYLIEERIKVILEHWAVVTEPVLNRVHGCNGSLTSRSVVWLSGDPSPALPGIQTVITSFPKGMSHGVQPSWLSSEPFGGLVEDRGRLEIRFVRIVREQACSLQVIARIPLDESTIVHVSRAAGLDVATSDPVMLGAYRKDEGIAGEVEANFIPGSRRPVPVVVVARNWETGLPESWVICQVRPSYARTIEDLSRMGLRTASWVSPLTALAMAAVLTYACGLFLSLRLSRRIVAVIEGLNVAAVRVGAGDFSVTIPNVENDQLGVLITAFNDMTRGLGQLREHEKQRAAFDRELALANETQQRLYPQVQLALSSASVWGMTAPARIVSGDLYDFIRFSEHELTLVCADVSGKGMPAALLMAHLQAVARGRVLGRDELGVRPSPVAVVSTLNEELRGRFGDHRYATMIYGDFDSRTGMLRYVNAGHCRPIVITENGDVITLPSGDFPIGLFPDVRYQELSIRLARGCAIVIYSDGLIDAMNVQGEDFGEERLLDHCRSLPKGATAQQICTLICRKVTEWSAGAERFDDTTIVALAVGLSTTALEDENVVRLMLA